MSNFDLWDWCEELGIPLKGIFARNEKMGKNHSPCIINLDEIEGLGTHWVCCWFSGGKFEFFDSFGFPPPLEWEKNIRKWFPRIKTFLRNDKQIQAADSVRCGYYCLMFLNERNNGKSFEEFLSMFSIPEENEKIVKKYFTKKK